MRVLQLCLSPNKGGLEIYVTRLANFLKHQTKVVTVIANDNNIDTYLKLPEARVFKLKRSIFSVFELAEIIDQNQVEIVHVHWTKDLPIAVMAKIISKQKPKLIQTRHMEMTQSKNDFYHRFLYQRVDLMIAITQEVKTQIEQLIDGFKAKTKLLYLGVPAANRIAKKQLDGVKQQYNIHAQFVLGIVGRIEAQKGQHIVVEAFAQLVEQGYDVQLLIVGETTLGEPQHQAYLSKLRQTIDEKNLNQKVIFTGFCAHVGEIVQALDVLVLATEHETFGMVLVEAMQAGICVVASNAGGPTEIIDHRQNGLLFNTLNSDDLMLKLKELADNQTLRLTLAKHGQQKAQRVFAENKQFEQVLTVYKDMLSVQNVG